MHITTQKTKGGTRDEKEEERKMNKERYTNQNRNNKIIFEQKDISIYTHRKEVDIIRQKRNKYEYIYQTIVILISI